uniref:Uncharacterized protein n=1 Tax=Anopheles merus TaxID=30066 RepID=A0A182V3E1_ANOME
MGTAAAAAGAVAGSNTFTSGMMMMVGLVSMRGGDDVAGGVGVGARGDDATGGDTNGVVTIGSSGTGTFSPVSVSCTCSSTSSDKGSCLSRVSSSSVGCCCSTVCCCCSNGGGGSRGGCAFGASTAARTVAVCTGVGSDCSTVAGATSPRGPVSVIWTGRGVGTGRSAAAAAAAAAAFTVNNFHRTYVQCLHLIIKLDRNFAQKIILLLLNHCWRWRDDRRLLPHCCCSCCC